MRLRSSIARGLPPWLRVAGVMFGVAWGANQFSSLLLAYRLHAGMSQSTADALFGVYALGLIPALLVLGPISDARGRRTIVAAAGLLSALASVVLIAGEHTVALLYAGRFLAGVCSGAAFAAGTAQIKELSTAPYDPGAGEQAGARRAAIALSGGFGLGALVAGLVAQWAPDPLVVAYVPHLIVMAVTMPLLLGAPETIAHRQPVPALRTILRVPSAGHVRFRRIVAPAAPWVFAAPAISFAVLPGLVSDQTGSFEVGFAALIAGLTLALGVSIQPLARRLDAVDDVRGTLAGLAAVTAGMLLGALAGAEPQLAAGGAGRDPARVRLRPVPGVGPAGDPAARLPRGSGVADRGVLRADVHRLRRADRARRTRAADERDGAVAVRRGARGGDGRRGGACRIGDLRQKQRDGTQR